MIDVFHEGYGRLVNSSSSTEIEHAGDQIIEQGYPSKNMLNSDFIEDSSAPLFIQVFLTLKVLLVSFLCLPLLELLL